MNRRTLLATLGLPALGLPGLARAQGGAYPDRPIRMIVPWPPGQATDLLGRIVAQKISEGLGRSLHRAHRSGTRAPDPD
jgi:tripartite-type tricarboxylate transporter receptor subunit TctC